MSEAKDHPIPQHKPGSNVGKGAKKGWNIRKESKGHHKDPGHTKHKDNVKVKVVESPIFIPYTRDSKLRSSLQEADDTLGEIIGSPAMKFVKRFGARQ